MLPKKFHLQNAVLYEHVATTSQSELASCIPMYYQLKLQQHKMVSMKNSTVQEEGDAPPQCTWSGAVIVIIITSANQGIPWMCPRSL